MTCYAICAVTALAVVGNEVAVAEVLRYALSQAERLRLSKRVLR